MIKLLLVDDEVDLLESLTRTLSRRGFAVAQARDGREALRLLGEGAYDAIVLDVKMPGIDGVEVFQRIKLRCPGLPVIMLTGHGSITQAFEASRDGVFEYLTKPCDVERLAEVVRSAVASRPTARPATDEHGGPPVRVLFVDDEVDFLEAMNAALARRKIDVLIATDAANALRLLAENPIDVVVTDVRMPGIDGLELLARLKLLKPLTEVILLTGHPTAEAAVEALRQGAFDFLAKPQSIDLLVSRIREAHRVRQIREREQREAQVRAALDERGK